MQKVTLRAPEPADINLVYIWENTTDEMHSSFRTGPISRHQITQYIENYNGDIYEQGSLRYMIDYQNETVGTIDVFDFDRRARHAFVGIYVTSNYRRRGIALTALKEVEGLMKKNVGMVSLAALIAEDNVPSQALFETADYTRVGELKNWLVENGEFFNARIYQRIL